MYHAGGTVIGMHTPSVVHVVHVELCINATVLQGRNGSVLDLGRRFAYSV